MSSIIEVVENCLLPSKKNYYLVRENDKLLEMLQPKQRLKEILNDIAVYDHIRALQSLYKDNYDEMDISKQYIHLLGNKDIKLDTDDTNSDIIKFTSKNLLKYISDGRARAIALCRLCYGDDSIEMIRAIVDLASTYAQEGLWSQVNHHLGIATQKGSRLIESSLQVNSKYIINDTNLKEIYLIANIFKCLRDHATRHFGHITKDIIAEIMSVVGQLPSKQNESAKCNDTGIIEDHTKFITSLHLFFNREGNDNPPTWGKLIDFFRHECEIFQNWIHNAESHILPQNLAILMLPFKQCDTQNRDVAHPIQLANLLSYYPSLSRILSGSKVIKSLLNMKIEIPLIIDPATGQIFNETNRASSNNSSSFRGQDVAYELPITWEEFLTSYLIDLSEINHKPIDIIRAQILILLGISQVFTSKLKSAEETLGNALKQIEYLDMESDCIACELYNAVAQMMIMKYRKYQQLQRVRAKQEANEILVSDRGKAAYRKEIQTLKQYYNSKNQSIPMNDLEQKARNNVINSLINSIIMNETKSGSRDDFIEANKAVDAAYRYLVKSYEIFEASHGTTHPIVGGACLAIASVLNITENYVEAREWLVRSLRKMQKLNPIPFRAIAFIQVQLSQILQKQGHDEESLQVLSKAASFHAEKARNALNSLTITREGLGTETFATIPANSFLPGRLVYDDVNTTVSLNEKLIKILESENKIQALTFAEINCEVIEKAYGWDSLEASNLRKKLGDMCASVGDWGRAVINFKKSCDVHEIHYGKNHPKTIQLNHLVENATTLKRNMYQDAILEQIETKQE